MASMACLGALRRTPGDMSIMSNLEILLEGFQKFQPVAPRIDTLVPIVSSKLQARSKSLEQLLWGSIETWLTSDVI